MSGGAVYDLVGDIFKYASEHGGVVPETWDVSFSKLKDITADMTRIMRMLDGTLRYVDAAGNMWETYPFESVPIPGLMVVGVRLTCEEISRELK
jgi:hypothetical protein